MGGDHIDWDFLGARLHARRARMCDARRLFALCDLRSLPALAAELGLDRNLTTARALERHLLRELSLEALAFVSKCQDKAAHLARWMLERHPLELLKTALRHQGAGNDKVRLRELLFELPGMPALDALVAASSPEEIVALVGDKTLQYILKQALARHRPDALFLFESALGQGYYQELLARARRLEGDAGCLFALMAHETDSFHLMLVARGRFEAGLPAEALRPMHVAGTVLSRTCYHAMLASPDLPAAVRLARDQVVDLRDVNLEEGPDPLAVTIERRRRAGHFELARRLFGRSDMGPGLLVAYLALRRIEVANLVAIAEGIRLGVPADLLRPRLVPVGREEARAA
jgi:vacuolar-type H+-ATPase subunit C/Vma6